VGPAGFVITDTNVHGTGSVKVWKTRRKMSVVVRIFLYSVSRGVHRAGVFGEISCAARSGKMACSSSGGDIGACYSAKGQGRL